MKARISATFALFVAAIVSPLAALDFAWNIPTHFESKDAIDALDKEKSWMLVSFLEKDREEVAAITLVVPSGIYSETVMIYRKQENGWAWVFMRSEIPYPTSTRIDGEDLILVSRDDDRTVYARLPWQTLVER